MSDGEIYPPKANLLNIENGTPFEPLSKLYQTIGMYKLVFDNGGGIFNDLFSAFESKTTIESFKFSNSEPNKVSAEITDKTNMKRLLFLITNFIFKLNSRFHLHITVEK